MTPRIQSLTLDPTRLCIFVAPDLYDALCKEGGPLIDAKHRIEEDDPELVCILDYARYYDVPLYPDHAMSSSSAAMYYWATPFGAPPAFFPADGVVKCQS